MLKFKLPFRFYFTWMSLWHTESNQNTLIDGAFSHILQLPVLNLEGSINESSKKVRRRLFGTEENCFDTYMTLRHDTKCSQKDLVVYPRRYDDIIAIRGHVVPPFTRGRLKCAILDILLNRTIQK